jgi:hypothetical protein
MSYQEKERASGSLNRRDLLKAAMVAPTAALVQLAPGAAAPSPAREAAEVSVEYAPKVFNAHQWKTLQVLSDIIIPKDEHSGSATEAGVPEFIDDWLNLNGGLLKTGVLGGLTWIDMECNRLFGLDFAACSETQQKQILDRIAYPGKAAREDANAAASFNQIRGLVLNGFFTSKMGVEDLQYQGNKMMTSWEGCPESATSQLGVNYSNWEHWKS